MKKKIKLCLAWHNINSTNYGVSALAISQIHMLINSTNISNIDLYTLGTDSFSGLKIKQEIESRYGIKIEHINFTLKKFVTNTLKLDFSSINEIRSYDVVIDIGEGDSFSDIYGMKRFFALSVTKLISIFSKKKIILAPQTIGPFNSSFAYFLAKFILKRTNNVFSRDNKTSILLDKMNCKYHEVSDVAFMLPFDQAPKVIDSVGINISGLLWHGGYTGDNQFSLTVEYQKIIFDLIDGFLKRGKNIHLIAHVIADNLPVEDDFSLCEKIAAKYADRKVICAPKFSSPIAAKSYISSMTFFTGSRMHATIAALSAGVVTIPIAYSRKFSGVFGGLGYPYTMDAYDKNFTTKTFVEKFFKHYDEHQSEMVISMGSAREAAFNRNELYLSALRDILSHAYEN